MPIFIALGKATPEGARYLGALAQRHEQAVRRAEEEGGKVLASYACLGRYDYLAILDCPDEKIALKILAKEASHGNVHYETMTAIPLDEFSSLVDTL
ncbi:MAG: GYD domain-containing protein [Dehalococcoidia bacterium]|nr:GYD domain-containing protein [Dehalococcoidia bacterium]